MASPTGLYNPGVLAPADGQWLDVSGQTGVRVEGSLGTGFVEQARITRENLMARIGPVWGTDIRGHSQLVKDAYAPLLAAADNSGITVAPSHVSRHAKAKTRRRRRACPNAERVQT